MKLWCFYLSGAVLTLAYKLARYIRSGNKIGKPWRVSLCEWFFEPSIENGVSWFTTVAIVWAFGSLYIGSAQFEGAEILKRIPQIPSFAFLFGGLIEWTAPNVAKWVVKKIPGNS